MAASTKKSATKKSASKAANNRSKSTFVTSIILDKTLHKWWTTECDLEHRSFSGVVSMLLERERARILQFRAATSQQGDPAAMTPAEQWMFASGAQAAKRKK